MTGHTMPALNSNGQQRARAGVIVTVREQQTGQLHTLHATGPAERVLTEVCEQIDRRDGDWRIVSISTPSSVFRDLQGIRGEREADRQKGSSTFSDPRSTEHRMLNRVGRLDLLQPLRTPGPDLHHGRVA